MPPGLVQASWFCAKRAATGRPPTCRCSWTPAAAAVGTNCGSRLTDSVVIVLNALRAMSHLQIGSEF
jgi:hypothetical protein